MSSVGVLIEKKSKYFCERRRKSKCPKKNFQSVRKGEKDKCGISGVRKKELKGEFRKKNQSVFGEEF